MIVNSVNLYKPYTNKANKTANALPQAHTAPAFMRSEKPSIPRQSAFSRLRALALGLMMGTSLNCGSANNTPDAKAITPPALDASAPIATIDSAVPTAAIDAIPNSNITAADILLDMYKAAGILPQNATSLPNVMEYDGYPYGFIGGTSATPANKLPHIVETFSESNANTVIYNGIQQRNNEVSSYTITYTVNPDKTITKQMKFLAPEKNLEFAAYNCKMAKNNGFIELNDFSITGRKITDAGFEEFDSGTLYKDYTSSMKKSGVGEIEVKMFQSSDATKSAIYYNKNWTNDGVLAMIPKKAEALTEQFGKVTHDLRTGALSIPIGRGKVSVLADLARNAAGRVI